MGSVVGDFLLPVELSFQLGNMEGCLDAIADGLQPTHRDKRKHTLLGIHFSPKKRLTSDPDTNRNLTLNFFFFNHKG